jgi:membrane fusion protein (multidrug efflux system)
VSVLRQILVLLILGGLGAMGWIALQGETGVAGRQGGGRDRPPPGVVVEPVVLDRIERAVSAVGVARPVRSVSLAPSASGRVTSLEVEGGQTVVEGDVILRLDDAAQRAAVDDAEAELRRAQAAFSRSEQLYAQGRVADNAFELVRAERATARAALAMARKALQDRTLRAPFAGAIGFLDTDIGAIIGGDDAVATLDDISALDVDFAVPERFFGELAPGAAIRATTEIYPGETFAGAVTGIDRRIDTVSRSFDARARIANPGARIPAGAFMRVTLVLDSREGIVAPEEAVVAEAGRTYVYVIAEGRAARRAVTLGQRRAGAVEVRDGLSEGELVVTRGLQKARDGAPVNILNPEAAPETDPDDAPQT